jgi:hypothetical protein
MTRLWCDIEGMIKHYKWDVKGPEKRTIIYITELTSTNYHLIGNNIWFGKTISHITPTEKINETNYILKI